MSRHGFVDDESEPGQFAMWRGRVMSAIRGKRGQKLLRDLIDALDAMPEKRLIRSALVTSEGCCTLGCVAQYRKVDVSDIAPEDFDDDREWCNGTLSDRMDIAELKRIAPIHSMAQCPCCTNGTRGGQLCPECCEAIADRLDPSRDIGRDD